MATYIYLYGTGESLAGNQNQCFLKCEIPTPDNANVSGFMPSVLHTYVMYAKDIGLTVSDIIVESNAPKVADKLQLVYSLWPLLYVNNSEIFTDAPKLGIGVWYKAQDKYHYQYSVQLNTDNAFYFKASVQALNEPNLTTATNTTNAVPVPGTVVQSNTAWSMTLDLPDSSDTAPSSTFTIVKHYNQLVIWDTLVQMQQCVSNPQSVQGLKEAMGKVLQAVVDRKYSYDALVPKWSNTWGAKPAYYDNMRNEMNNFNIGASLYTYDDRRDPNDKNTSLYLLGTALNIKGSIKAGHAETRLLLTLDALNAYGFHNPWFNAVVDFFGFTGVVNPQAITHFYDGKNMALLSSLKPCYLCVGETEASVEGAIESINHYPVNMWASFPNIPANQIVKDVIYFDIDEPIDYASTIQVTWANEQAFSWQLALAPWSQWTAMWHREPDSLIEFTSPSGPRVVAPAGECLKTGYSFLRYLNSAKLLCSPQSVYLNQMKKWTSGRTQDVEQ